VVYLFGVIPKTSVGHAMFTPTPECTAIILTLQCSQKLFSNKLPKLSFHDSLDAKWGWYDGLLYVFNKP